MTDEDLMAGARRGALPPGTFDHRAHLRLAWLYLTQFGRGEGERRLLLDLRRLAESAGTPQKFDADLTRAWVERLESARQRSGARSCDELLARHPELTRKDAVLSADTAAPSGR